MIGALPVLRAPSILGVLPNLRALLRVFALLYLYLAGIQIALRLHDRRILDPVVLGGIQKGQAVGNPALIKGLLKGAQPPRRFGVPRLLGLVLIFTSASPVLTTVIFFVPL